MLEKQLKIINKKNRLKALKAELKKLPSAQVFIAVESANIGLLKTSKS